MYFGEDYYSENDLQLSDEEEVNQADPYAAADLIHKISEQNPITKHTEYVDKINNIKKHNSAQIILDNQFSQTALEIYHRH